MAKLIIILTFTATLIVSTLTAQETQTIKVREYGIGLNNLNNFSLQFRWGTEKRLYRINANIGALGGSGKESHTTNAFQDSVSSSSSTIKNSQNPLTLNFGLSFSILKLNSINEKFGIMYGSNFGLSYSYRNNSSDQTANAMGINGTTQLYVSYGKTVTQTWQPFLGVVLGAFYKINSSFIIYAEIGPNLYYSYTTSSSRSTYSSTDGSVSNSSLGPSSSSTFGLSNLSNSGASLTFVYRITR